MTEIEELRKQIALYKQIAPLLSAQGAGALGEAGSFTSASFVVAAFLLKFSYCKFTVTGCTEADVSMSCGIF